MTIALAVLSCNKKSNKASERRTAEVERSQSPLSKEAEALTEKAYDLKLEGRNGEALSLFTEAAEKIERAEGRKSTSFASNLDDRATIYLRTGSFDKAEALYRRAEDILKNIDQAETRLFAGVRRRMKTLEALQKMGIVCSEPMQPASSVADADSKIEAGESSKTESLPYFPKSEDLQRAFGIFNSKLKGCVDAMPGALPVWTVVTGDGRLALVSVKSEVIDKKTRACVENQLLEVSRRHPELLPKFGACFRNFTYPLAFRK